MAFTDTDRRGRVLAATGAAIVQAALIWALVFGLAVPNVAGLDEGLDVFAVATPPEPKPRIVPERQKTHRREGAASPRSLRAQATEVVAPPPIVPLPVPPPPVIAAPVAGTGDAANQGASDLPGPGFGSGGIGDGRGSGGSGDGDGDGYETPPRWKKGRIKDSDYPRGAGDAGAGGTVSVRYRIELDGRVTGCVITRSSGNFELDETTCRLIEQRFRYEPSRDARGRPVISYIVRDNEWVVERVRGD